MGTEQVGPGISLLAAPPLAALSAHCSFPVFLLLMVPLVSQPFILAAGDMASSKTRPLLSRAEFLERRQSVDKSPNWQGRPLREIEFLVSVQALGARAVWGQSGSGLIVDWPLLVTDLPFLQGQLSG